MQISLGLRPLMIAGLVSLAAIQAPATARAAGPELTGHMQNFVLAPAARSRAGIKWKNANGEAVGLGDYKGKVVLLNFWATWCRDCTRETPSLVKLHGRRRDDLVILGVTVRDFEANVQAFADRQKITYSLLMDDDAAVANLYELEFLPTNVIVDADGEIHDTIVGFGTVAHFDAFVLRRLYELIPRAVAPRGKAAVTWAKLKAR